MNDIISTFFLSKDKFLPEMHLQQPGFTYSACRTFTKNQEKMQKFKKQEIEDIFIKTN